MTNEIIESGTDKIVNTVCVEAEQSFTVEQVDIIRNTIAPNLTDDELKIFLYQCVRSKLDPICKQIYAVKRGGQMCIQTGIDGFRLIAERTGKYSPGKDTEFLYCTKGFLLGAKVYVKKMTADGTWHDISATALFREYNAGQGLWSKMPHVMIEKCAESRALRRAFPADLSGLYSEDEMQQADKKDVAPKVKAVAPKVKSVETAVKAVETAVNDDPDSSISDEQWFHLDALIADNSSLRDKLTKVCRVDTLRDIKHKQLGGCRGYAQACIDRESSAASES